MPESPVDVISLGETNNRINLKITGKNLFDKSKITLNTILNTDGTIFDYSYEGRFTSDYIECKANTIYSGFHPYLRICFYDKQKNLIECNEESSYYRTSPSNSYYIRFNGLNNNLSSIQLEEGNAVSNYEPYKERNIEITLDEPLRCIGDVCDDIDYANRRLLGILVK